MADSWQNMDLNKLKIIKIMTNSVSFEPDYSGTISGFESDLAKKINDNIYVSPKELIIITSDFYDGNTFLFTGSYLLFKESFYKLNLREHYVIHSDAEELAQMTDIYNVTSYGSVSRKKYNEYTRKHNWDIKFE